MFKSLYCCLTRTAETLQSVLLLLIRLYWGFGFFWSGYGKLNNISGAADFFGELGIPFPVANAYIAGSIECFGGLLLIVGLFSRFAAIPLSVVMLVAYATAHGDVLLNIWRDPEVFVSQTPFGFLLASLLVLAFGPGKISLDYLICKLFFQKCGNDQCPKS